MASRPGSTHPAIWDNAGYVQLHVSVHVEDSRLAAHALLLILQPVPGLTQPNAVVLLHRSPAHTVVMALSCVSQRGASRSTSVWMFMPKASTVRDVPAQLLHNDVFRSADSLAP